MPARSKSGHVPQACKNNNKSSCYLPHASAVKRPIWAKFIISIASMQKSQKYRTGRSGTITNLLNNINYNRINCAEFFGRLHDDLMLWPGPINGLLLISGKSCGIFGGDTGTAMSLIRGFKGVVGSLFCFSVSSSISGTCQVGHFDSHTFCHLD